jgi:catechol 2,3-dioxygenase-like lactoylglutathione lyase family enzyme
MERRGVAGPPHLRVAKPVSDLTRARDMYSRGLGLRVLGSFQNHDGFDGVMLGVPGAGYHFEFTRARHHPQRPSPTLEDLVVFYIPDDAEWRSTCDRMLEAGFSPVRAFNPYWEARGRTYEDGDGYRIVLERAGFARGCGSASRGGDPWHLGVKCGLEMRRHSRSQRKP